MINIDPETIEARKRQHDLIRSEIEKRTVANAENLDKSILTYSASGLALSLGFLKDFVHISIAACSWLLYSSWCLFVLAVVTTLFSYLTSQLAQRRQLEISYSYNIELNDSALTATNFAASATQIATYLAAGFFVLALSASTSFVAINLPKRKPMTDQTYERLIEAPPVPHQVQSVPNTRGAPVPSIQPIPASTPATPAPSTSPPVSSPPQK